MTPWYKIENSILYRLDRLAERNGCLVDLFWSFPSLLLPLYQNFKYQVMNVKRHFWTVACTVLFICSSAATAQEVGKKLPDRQERGFNPMPLSPEKSARHATDRMNSLLNLTEKQYDKLYKLNLKWAREDKKNNSTVPPMNNKPEGMPNFRGSRVFGQRPHGNRPPEDIERRPLRDFALSNDKEKIEKQRKKREKKLKKILTDKQYVRWVEKQHPAIPEDREKGKRKEQ